VCTCAASGRSGEFASVLPYVSDTFKSLESTHALYHNFRGVPVGPLVVLSERCGQDTENNHFSTAAALMDKNAGVLQRVRHVIGDLPQGVAVQHLQTR
jgi:hypothetical protein